MIPFDSERVHKKKNSLGGYNNNVLDIYKIPEILSKNCITKIRVSHIICYICVYTMGHSLWPIKDKYNCITHSLFYL